MKQSDLNKLKKALNNGELLTDWSRKLHLNIETLRRNLLKQGIDYRTIIWQRKKKYYNRLFKKCLAFAEKNKRIPTSTEFKTMGIPVSKIGLYRIKLSEKGFEQRFFNASRISDKELLKELYRIYKKTGELPRHKHIVKYSRYSHAVYNVHFGSITNAVSMLKHFYPDMKVEKQKIEKDSKTPDHILRAIERSNLFLKEYTSGLTLEKIGIKYNLTKERVRQSITERNSKAYQQFKKQRRQEESAFKLSKFMAYTSELGRVPRASEILVYDRTLSEHYYEFRKAAVKTGYVVLRKKKEKKYTNEELLSYLKMLADKLGHTPSSREIEAAGKYSSSIYPHYFGSFKKAQQSAGLTPNNSGNTHELALRTHRFTTKEECMNDLKRMVLKLGHIPSQSEIQKHGKYSATTFMNRFGGIKGIKKIKELQNMMKAAKKAILIELHP